MFFPRFSTDFSNPVDKIRVSIFFRSTMPFCRVGNVYDRSAVPVCNDHPGPAQRNTIRPHRRGDSRIARRFTMIAQPKQKDQPKITTSLRGPSGPWQSASLRPRWGRAAQRAAGVTDCHALRARNDSEDGAGPSAPEFGNHPWRVPWNGTEAVPYNFS